MAGGRRTLEFRGKIWAQGINLKGNRVSWYQRLFITEQIKQGFIDVIIVLPQ
jgi:hypothetical protein